MQCHVTVWIDPRQNHIRAVLFCSLSFVTVQCTGWTSQEYLMAGKQCWQEHMVSSALVNGSPCMCMRHAAIMGNCPVCHMVQVTTFPASVCTLIFIVVVATSTRITDLSNPSSCDAWVGCPTYYDSMKAALASMEKTYHVNYLQVFNMHGRLIQPSEYFALMKQYLYDVQAKVAQLSFTSISLKCPQNPLSTCNFYTVFYIQHISTYCQTNYHIPFI